MFLQTGGRGFRVAFFAGTMRPGHDGVTRILYRTIDAMRENGIESLFFSPIVPPADARSVSMIKVPSVAFPLYPDYRLAVPGQNHIEGPLDEFAPDLIHIHSPCSLGFAAIHYGERRGIPVVATYHTHFPSYAKYYKIKALEAFSWTYLRRLYNGCERVYVPSEPIRKELRGHGFTTTEFLPHGVDAGTFNPSFRSDEWRRSLGCEGKTVLLFSGRLVWEKDLRTLAGVYRQLAEKRDDVRFVLVGDGPIRGELEAMMPRAVFLGYQSGRALSTAYASSDVFVFPSTTETFGNVTLEAMASGIPPVCAREGGAYGFVTNGVTGLLAEPRDADDLARHITCLVDSPERRRQMGEAALAFARSQSWDAVFQRLFTSYSAVAAGGCRVRKEAA
jgi:glycosyltransferase involved in cell wall biosynthesis